MDIRFSKNSPGVWYISYETIDDELCRLEGLAPSQDFYRSFVLEHKTDWRECCQYPGNFYFAPNDNIIPQPPSPKRRERKVQHLTFSLQELVESALEGGDRETH